MVEPTNARLAVKLGLRTKAEREYYNVIVVGGGPAGLTAALYLAREGLDTLVIEKAGLGVMSILRHEQFRSPSNRGRGCPGGNGARYRKLEIPGEDDLIGINKYAKSHPKSGGFTLQIIGNYAIIRIFQ